LWVIRFILRLDTSILAGMAIGSIKTALREILKTRRNANGIWGYQGDEGAIEPTFLALLALRREIGSDIAGAVHMLQNLQNADGSWSAFADDEAVGCWTTALAMLTLLKIGGPPGARASSIHWLVNAKGREAHWFWRWKFQTVDKSVQFDPAKYGWSWVLGTTSWVIPTAFTLIALQQIKGRGLSPTTGVVERIDNGVSMLLDRACPRGGWNAGNGTAFGMPYAPYIDATGIALLALGEHKKEPSVEASLAWLVNRLPRCRSPYSLAWGILALATYREISSEVDETVGRATNELTALIEKGVATNDICTLAVCALALEAAEGDNVFEVRG
jgi:hypothetical protein